MIEINLLEEFQIFLTSVNNGIIAGLIYDFYRVFRHYSKPKKILSIIEDFLFWVLVSFIFFRLLVINTDGIVRGFVFLGFFIGGAFYLKVISKYNFPMLIKFFKLIFTAINEIMKIILYPLSLIKKLLKGGLKKSTNIFGQYFKDIRKYVKIVLKKK